MLVRNYVQQQAKDFLGENRTIERITEEKYRGDGDNQELTEDRTQHETSAHTTLLSTEKEALTSHRTSPMTDTDM